MSKVVMQASEERKSSQGGSSVQNFSLGHQSVCQQSDAVTIIFQLDGIWDMATVSWTAKCFQEYYWTLYIQHALDKCQFQILLWFLLSDESHQPREMRRLKNSPLEHANLLQLEWGYYWIFWLAMSPECSPTSWPSLPMASRNATETQDADFVILLCPDFGEMNIYLSTSTSRSWWSQWGSHVSLSHLFVIVMKVMVWDFVSGSHKVMAALVV